MTLKIVDTIPAHTLELGDTIGLEVEGTLFIKGIDDQGELIELTGIDEYEDDVTVSIAPDVVVPLLVDVPDPEEDI